jgi:hypothetical protein
VPTASCLGALVDEFSSGDDLGWLVSGSVARGEEHTYSDVDLTRFTAAGPAAYRDRYSVQYWRGRLVSIMTRTVDAARTDLRTPSGAIWAVEGIRQARILQDPTGELERLKAEAVAFEWAPLQAAATDWVSYQVAHAAEEVHKLLGLRQRGHLSGLANATMGLNLTIGYAMAVDHGVLFRSENTWIDQVIEAIGTESPWSRAFHQSLGLTEAPGAIWNRSAGALGLYAETVTLVAERMLPPDRAVAVAALGRIQQEEGTHGPG